MYYGKKRAPVGVTVLALSVLLAGCAGSAVRSYDGEMKDTVADVRAGDVAGALARLEGNAPKTEATQADDPTGGRDILYFFEKGQLLRLNNEIEQSRDAWLQADEVVRIWEDAYKKDPTQVISEVGAFLVNDKVRRYDGQDYEKVFLSANLALDHVLLDDVQSARIEMKKTFEREKLIESFREKEYDKIKEEGSKQGVLFKLDDLAKKGYPVAELEDQEVVSLKNGYQNAFAHYLAGYFFEVKGEKSLADPGYRNALELRPGSRLIKEKVGNVGKVKPGPNQADVLFVIESGFAPSWKSHTVPLPLPINKEVVIVPLSFPTVVPDARVYVPSFLNVAGKTLPVETLVNVDALARRQLKDQLPGIIGRTAIRGILKGALQYEATKKGGKLAGALTAIGTTYTEQADERSWRTLPARISIARAILPVGEQTVTFDSGYGVYSGTITVDGKMAIIPVRLVNGYAYIGQRNVIGTFKASPQPVEEKATAPAKAEPESKGFSLPKFR
jgi:hypothetical protein